MRCFVVSQLFYNKHTFRVWKQNKDNLVGFMSRSASYKGGKPVYLYGGPTPKMVLTQVLFHHKYYSYVNKNNLKSLHNFKQILFK